MNTTITRFAFLAEAFNGTGGFAPTVSWEDQRLTTTDQEGNTLTTSRRVPKLSTPAHLVQYPRESAEKYAARCAVSVYENHLREACERFVGYLGRRQPIRGGIDAPLVKAMLEDADMRGCPLDQFMVEVALQTKARGSMLIVLDMPTGQEQPASLQQQIEARAVPYLRTILPETVTDYEIDDDTGLFNSVSVTVMEVIGGKRTRATRTWTTTGWEIKVDSKVIQSGEHPFGACPVLAITESGGEFPHVGKYAQIADLSTRLFNARSERDELLRSQTFSLLTLQVPPESAASFDATRTAATIGTHSMLVHAGATPAFISPDSGPAQTYLAAIEELQQAIKRVAMDEATTEGGGTESGVARKLRFERLNADLASFARRLQALERRMWALFHRALGTTNRVTVEWPSDFNLVDTLGELDVLTLMQSTGFPPEVLAEKRASIVSAEFDAADEDTKADLLAAVREQAQEPIPPQGATQPAISGQQQE